MTILLMHGGASNLLSEAFNKKQKAVDDAIAAVSDLAGNALDIVERAVSMMELNPDLNAGYGSVLQLDGQIRMDAGICTDEGKYAGILQIQDTRTPIKVARALMEIGYHSLLSGEGARKFADEKGFPKESAVTPEQMNAYQEAIAQFPSITYDAVAQEQEILNRKKLSTVGAVAIDDLGRMAAACSTGGTMFCYPGRIGDTAIFGSGVYCSQHVAVALTGEGDKVLRRMTARIVEDVYLRTNDLALAVKEAVQDLENDENGQCGIIAVSKDRQFSHSHNTKHMAFALRH